MPFWWAGQLTCGTCVTAISPFTKRGRVVNQPLGTEFSSDVREADVLMGEPIVGVENETLNEHGEGARAARPLPSPTAPSRAVRERHNLTHLPYADWCPFCVACRRPNTPHRASHESEREVPLLVADYGFVRNPEDQDVVTMLIIKVMPFKIFFSTVVDVKGPDPAVVKRVSRFILELGLVNFVYRADRENYIQALLDEAVKMSGAHGIPQPIEPVEREEPQTFMDEAENDPGIPDRVNAEPVQTATPELTQPGESQSNGIAERAIQQVVDLFRTIKTSFESRIGARVPMAHPLTKWMVEHAAFLLTKYQLGPDGRTGWGRLHGKEVRERLCEFGEKFYSSSQRN